jgi:uroporphyrinogen-III synthase
VGSATAKSATSHGFRHVIDADGDAMVLAGVVARALSPADGSILLPSGGGQGLELAKTLRSKGFRVVRRVAYRAVSVPALPAEAVRELREGQLAKAMFFSAETARHFVRLILEQGLGSAVHDVEAVSISERPVVALRRLAWRRISVADKPNQEAMLALL